MTMTMTEKKKMGRPTVADKGQVIGVRVKTPHHTRSYESQRIVEGAPAPYCA